VTLHFVRTTENLADYLTRQGLPKGDLEKLNLKNIEVKDFYDKLPKIEYSLREWAQFCQDNPQYLTTTAPTVNLMTLSLTTAIKNVSRQVEPLMLLKRKLCKENIINEQRRQYNGLIQEISALERKKQPLRKGNLIYVMEWDVLYVSHTTDGVPEQEKQNKANLLRQQILLPDSLVGILLSFVHLQGHYGTEKMLVNMQDFYFPNMYQITKQFVGSCYSCFLQNPSSRRNVLGIYLTPDRVFQEVSMDLAENLNTVRGMSHLLICQDVLSDYIIIYPMKTKTATETAKNILYGILQHYEIEKIHSDNGVCFRSKDWLKLMSAIHIKVIDNSSNNPQARGKAERAVGMVKTMMKKMIAAVDKDTYNWEGIPFLVSKIMNNTVCPRTGFTPNQMVFGFNKAAKPRFLTMDLPCQTHHLVKNDKVQIEQMTKEIELMTKIAQQHLDETKERTTKRENINRIKKEFKINDIVFVIDR
jgi:hypothetical protein